MKVICIDAGYRKEAMTTGASAEGYIVEGTIYTVIQVIPPILTCEGYVLAEVKSDHWTGAFLSLRFAPLSEINESEFNRNYIKEKI